MKAYIKFGAEGTIKEGTVGLYGGNAHRCGLLVEITSHNSHWKEYSVEGDVVGGGVTFLYSVEEQVAYLSRIARERGFSQVDVDYRNAPPVAGRGGK